MPLCNNRVYASFVVCSEVLPDIKWQTFNCFFPLLVVAVTCSAWCYAKHDFIKNKEVRLSEVVTPQANECQPQPGNVYLMCSWFTMNVYQACFSNSFLTDHRPFSVCFILFLLLSIYFFQTMRFWLNQSTTVLGKKKKKSLLLAFFQLLFFPPLRHVFVSLCCCFKERLTEPTAVCCPTCLSRARIAIGRPEALGRMIKADLMWKLQQRQWKADEAPQTPVTWRPLVPSNYVSIFILSVFLLCFFVPEGFFYCWVIYQKRVRKWNH